MKFSITFRTLGNSSSITALLIDTSLHCSMHIINNERTKAIKLRQSGRGSERADVEGR